MQAFPRVAATVALGALLLLGSCQSHAPQYDSHWNVGSLGPRVQYHMTGYRAEQNSGYYDFEQSNAESMALSFRRHFLNDDPSNPLQLRRGWGNADNPYNMTSLPADMYYLGRDALVATVELGSTLVLMPIDLVVGPTVSFFAVDWQGVTSLWQGDAGEPAPPAQFRMVGR